MSAFRRLSVVIPVYNSAEILPRLIERLSAVLRAEKLEHEVVLVNDGSRDGSWQVIEKLSRENAAVRGIDLMRNYGQHNAVLCGIRAAVGDVIVTMDDDLQHPPEEIPKLLAVLEEGADVVYGAPLEYRHGMGRDLASWITRVALGYVMGVPAGRHVSPFRALRTQLRDAFADYRSPFVSVDVLLSWATARFAVARVRQDDRASGVSGYSFYRLVMHAFNMMTGYSALPLQVASVMGFLFSLFGACVLVFVVAKRLVTGVPVPGFAFLASCLAIFSGVQLFAIGIIGEYMARIHFRTVEKPQYAVRRKLAKEGAAS